MKQNKTDIIVLAKEALVTMKKEMIDLKENVNKTTKELFPKMEESDFVKYEKEELNRH
jgi:hypothetical protein